MPKSNELVDLTLVQFHETDSAYLVGETEDSDKAVWIPKSKCERGRQYTDVRTDRGPKNVYEFTIEQWLAEDKGLV